MRLIGADHQRSRQRLDQIALAHRYKDRALKTEARTAAVPSVPSRLSGQNVYPWLWTVFLIVVLQTLVLTPARGQTDEENVPARSIVEVQGTVSSVELNRSTAGSAMQRGCLLQVKTERGELIPVRLGPMRYLMEHSFSPRSGDEIRIRGYRLSTDDENAEVVALSVDLPGRGQKLELRDEEGRPVWSGHHRRQRRGQGKR